MLLIDSSSIVKFYSKEEGWEKVMPYMKEASTIPLALVELGNGLRKKARKGDIDGELAARLLEGYAYSVPLADQNKRLADALRISIENGISVYDALFVAVASWEGYDLVSSDKKQADVSEKLGVRTVRG